MRTEVEATRLRRLLRPERGDAQPVLVERGVRQRAHAGKAGDLGHRRLQRLAPRREMNFDVLHHTGGERSLGAQRREGRSRQEKILEVAAAPAPRI